MLTLLAAAAVSALPVAGFAGATDAFDAACRAPGPDRAAQRAAIAAVAQPADPQAHGSETFDGPAGRYILIGMGDLTFCALNTAYNPQSFPADPIGWFEAHYGSKPRLHEAGTTKSYAWDFANRNFKVVLADDASNHVLLMSVADRK